MSVLEPIPLNKTSNGVFRVGNTRVTLDSVITSYTLGATPEEIVQQFPSLILPDVYAVVTYYLRHKDEVESYLAGRRERSKVVRAENERRFPAEGFRERLLARQRG
ncbi:MAG: DUF433 domain-containing protein [Trueperaceae bacterium]